MPIFYQQEIDHHTKLAIWQIAEEEDFFLQQVPLNQEIRHPHKRLQHLAGRYLLKYLFPDFPLELIQIADTKKPFLVDEAYHFSISHCADYAAVIVSRSKRVGIDVEIPNEKVQRILNKFSNTYEREQIDQFGNSQLLPLATKLWSAKEAVFKWWGNGKVDFSDMINVKGISSANEGILEGQFSSAKLNAFFPLHYRWLGEIVMVWLITEPNLS